MPEAATHKDRRELILRELKAELGTSAIHRFQRPSVMNFILGQWSNLVRRHFGHRNRPPLEGNELDHKLAAPFIGMNDSPHVTRGQPVFGQVLGQRNAIQFSDHAGKG